MTPDAERIARSHVAQYAGACGNTMLDADDLHAIARLAAWRAEQSHKEDGGRSLNSYVWERVRYALLNALRDNHSWGCAVARITREYARREEELPAVLCAPVPLSGLLATTDGEAAPLEEMIPDEAAEGAVERLLIRAAVAGLPEPHRTVVRLRYWEGQTLTEIGARFDRSAPWSTFILGEAARHLRAALREP